MALRLQFDSFTMKKTPNTPKKLALTIHTIRVLAPTDLARAVGGFIMRDTIIIRTSG